VSPPLAIAMHGVRKAFRFFALEDLSLALEPGQTLGLVGPNGAGKSTTIHLAMGLLTADAGEVRVLGHAMPREQAAAKADIGFVSSTMRLFPHASLAWHQQFLRRLDPRWDDRYAARLAKQFDLHAEQTVAELSSGEQVKVALLLALARRPRLLVLDEPTTGLDPVARHEVLGALAEAMQDEARAVLFSSHQTADVERIADRLTFLDRGRVVASADKESFLERWRRILVRLSPGQPLPELPGIVERTEAGPLVTLVTDQFSQAQLAALGGRVQEVREVQRMTLEEIFVSTVMAARRRREA
jgi:ABC-2 type transport system ATP-binding protein